MSRFGRQAMAAALGLAFCAGAMAQEMTKEQYQSAKDAIAADTKAGKVACGSLAANAKDICQAEGKGNDKVARANLELQYKPSIDAQYKLRLARADADYGVAREKCDDSAGNVKDVCVKEAKAVQAAARADAKARMTQANANRAARKTGSEARDAAAATTRDADYAVARERCDAFAGDTKSTCLAEAKARFGKS